MHEFLFKSFIWIAIVFFVMSLLVLEADITETTSSTEGLKKYVSKYRKSWDPFQ